MKGFDVSRFWFLLFDFRNQCPLSQFYLKVLSLILLFPALLKHCISMSLCCFSKLLRSVSTLMFVLLQGLVAPSWVLLKETFKEHFGVFVFSDHPPHSPQVQCWRRRTQASQQRSKQKTETANNIVIGGCGGRCQSKKLRISVAESVP
jgi:hypothetical protein